MKKIGLFLVFVLILSLAAGCSTPESTPEEEETPQEPVQVTIAGLKGPTSIGMVKMMEEKQGNDDNYHVEYITEGTPDALTGKIINGEIQISSVPINLASVLYHKTEGAVQIMALNTIGNLYIVGTDEISSLEDLQGKSLGMSGKGATPDYAMNYILKQKGLEDKVELDYTLDHASLAQQIIAEDIKVALLPQPFVTQVMMQNNKVKMLLDLKEEWAEVTQGNSELITGAIIVNREFAQNNKEFVAQFLEEYEASVSWVTENPKDASVLVEKNEIMPSAAVAEAAIPYCGITYQFAANEKESIQHFYQILLDSNPASIGGSLPNEDFYYSK